MLAQLVRMLDRVNSCHSLQLLPTISLKVSNRGQIESYHFDGHINGGPERSPQTGIPWATVMSTANPFQLGSNSVLPTRKPANMTKVVGSKEIKGSLFHPSTFCKFVCLFYFCQEHTNSDMPYIWIIVNIQQRNSNPNQHLRRENLNPAHSRFLQWMCLCQG